MSIGRIQPIAEMDRIKLIEGRIKDYILENQLRPGDKLPTEEQFSTALQVGRTAVRETFRRLEALGIVESHQGFGRVVREFNFDPILDGLFYGMIFHGNSVMQILEIRRALDDYFIKDAIANLSDEDIAKLEALVQKMRESEAANLHDQFNQMDHDFHTLLYSRCGNSLALQLFEITWRVRLHTEGLDDALSKIQAGALMEHIAIFEAIKARDVPLARKMLAAHHDNLDESLSPFLPPNRKV